MTESVYHLTCRQCNVPYPLPPTRCPRCGPTLATWDGLPSRNVRWAACAKCHTRLEREEESKLPDPKDCPDCGTPDHGWRDSDGHWWDSAHQAAVTQPLAWISGKFDGNYEGALLAGHADDVHSLRSYTFEVREAVLSEICPVLAPPLPVDPINAAPLRLPIVSRVHILYHTSDGQPRSLFADLHDFRLHAWGNASTEQIANGKPSMTGRFWGTAYARLGLLTNENIPEVTSATPLATSVDAPIRLNTALAEGVDSAQPVDSLNHDSGNLENGSKDVLQSGVPENSNGLSNGHDNTLPKASAGVAERLHQTGSLSQPNRESAENPEFSRHGTTLSEADEKHHSSLDRLKPGPAQSKGIEGSSDTLNSKPSSAATIGVPKVDEQKLDPSGPTGAGETGVHKADNTLSRGGENANPQDSTLSLPGRTNRTNVEEIARPNPSPRSWESLEALYNNVLPGVSAGRPFLKPHWWRVLGIVGLLLWLVSGWAAMLIGIGALLIYRLLRLVLYKRRNWPTPKWRAWLHPLPLFLLALLAFWAIATDQSPHCSSLAIFWLTLLGALLLLSALASVRVISFVIALLWLFALFLIFQPQKAACDGTSSQSVRSPVTTTTEQLKRRATELISYDKDAEIISAGPAIDKNERRVSLAQALEDPSKYFSCNRHGTTEDAPVEIYLGESALFGFNSDRLNADAEANLQKLATLINSDTNASIVLTGHTDKLGTPLRNLKLSEQRAKRVAEWLISNQVLPADRIDVRGAGNRDPVVDDPALYRMNRRVEMHIDCPDLSRQHEATSTERQL